MYDGNGMFLFLTLWKVNHKKYESNLISPVMKLEKNRFRFNKIIFEMKTKICSISAYENPFKHFFLNDDYNVFN